MSFITLSSNGNFNINYEDNVLHINIRRGGGERGGGRGGGERERE